MHTDAGFMRIILYFGGIGAFFVYASFLSLLFLAISKLKNEQFALYMCEITLVLFFLAEYKGDPYALFFGVAMVLLLSSKDVSQEGSFPCRR